MMGDGAFGFKAFDDGGRGEILKVLMVAGFCVYSEKMAPLSYGGPGRVQTDVTVIVVR